jgi:MFS family permease
MADAISIMPSSPASPADAKTHTISVTPPGAPVQATPVVRGLSPPWYTVVFLPYGTTTGFFTITLGYTLANHGISFKTIAGVAGLFLLPNTLAFVVGPFLDIWLNPKKWYLLSMVVGAVCLLALGLAPETPQTTSLLNALALACGIAFTAVLSAGTASMTLTTPMARRATVSGFAQVGTYSGIGAGGGAALWLATHGAGQAGAAIIMSGLCIVCAAPVLWLRLPARPDGQKLADQTLDLGKALWELFTTRNGVLTVLVQTMPAGIGASFRMMAGLATQWKADANLVALTIGGLGALISIPGCIVGGYLCAKITGKAGYVAVSLVLAIAGTVMALGPRTPFAFAAQVLFANFLLGICVTTCQAVVYEFLDHRATATMASVLNSLSNLPVVAMTFLVGWSQARFGTTNMMLQEAVLGAVAVVGYAILVRLWRPPSLAHGGGGRP